MIRFASCALLLSITAPALAADLGLRGSLSGAHVVSATESPATGEVAAVLEDDNDLRIDLIYSGLATNATGAGLYVGKANENGTRVAPLGIAAGTTEGRLRGATVRLTPAVASRVRAGEAYVQIVSLEQPGGVIRAQLAPQGATLSTPPAATPAVSASATTSTTATAASGSASGTTTLTPSNPVNDDDRDSDDD